MSKKSNLINLRVKAELRKLLQKKADEFTGGNISAWIRKASVEFVPKSKTS